MLSDNRISAAIRGQGDVPLAQIDIIHNELQKNESVRLYTPKGVMLAEMDYQGDDELGYMLGLALYQGYVSGREKHEYEMRVAIEQAFRQKGEFAV